MALNIWGPISLGNLEEWTAMLGTLLGLIFFCIIAGVIVWACMELMKLIPLGEPFRTIVRILFVVICVIVVIYVAQILLGMAGIRVNSFHMSQIDGSIRTLRT